ncbi:MAG: hypothetical protein K6F22_09825 [Prevotella sp.]|nr:hypothetical protein [Prevotella sp.]
MQKYNIFSISFAIHHIYLQIIPEIWLYRQLFLISNRKEWDAAREAFLSHERILQLSHPKGKEVHWPRAISLAGTKDGEPTIPEEGQQGL